VPQTHFNSNNQMRGESGDLYGLVIFVLFLNRKTDFYYSCVLFLSSDFGLICIGADCFLFGLVSRTSVGECAAGWSSPCHSRVGFPLSIKVRPGSSFGVTVQSRKQGARQERPFRF
jgi:hypothetical protein